MTDKISCNRCGSELPANAPAGVCPRCLLQAGLLESTAEIASAVIDATIQMDSIAPSGRANDLPTERDGASSGNTPEPGEKLRYFGEYELLAEIARGGMAQAKTILLSLVLMALAKLPSPKS